MAASRVAVLMFALLAAGLYPAVARRIRADGADIMNRSANDDPEIANPPEMIEEPEHHVTTVEDFGDGEEECEACEGGDMIPGPYDPEDGASLVERSNRSEGTVSLAAKWPDGVVKFAWAPGIGAEARRATEEGMAEWTAKTCITFQEVAPGKGVVTFKDSGRGCYAHVGYLPRYNKAYMNLGKGCRTKGTAIHEIGHTVGLSHEHQRSDFEEYVDVLTSHVQPDMLKANFGKKKGGIVEAGIPYDLGSIMHYGGWAFSAKKKDGGYTDATRTIRVKKPDVYGNCRIGQRSFLSQGDIMTVNKWYGCPDRFCADLHEDCAGLARKGFCPGGTKGSDGNKQWMGQNCAKSCQLCTCEDKDDRCAKFAAKGYCARGSKGTKENQAWMSQKCAKSCGRCSMQDPHCKDDPRGAWNSGRQSCAKYGMRKDKHGMLYCLHSWYSQKCPQTCGACPAKKFCF